MSNTPTPTAPRPPLRAASVLVLCLAAAAGCTVGPNFQRSAVRLPAAWAEPVPGDQGAAKPSDAALATWWTAFSDAKLASLVERALASNLDVKLAEARLRQARAARGVATADLGPTLDANGSARRGRAAGVTTSQYQAGFDAAWELDIFGGARRGVEAANADLAALDEARRDVLVTLAAEVARDYFELRSYQQRAAIAHRNLETQQHSAKLTRQRQAGGLVSRLDVANADAQVASTSAEIPSLEASARQAIHALGVLLGRDPAALTEELSSTAEIPSAPPVVPVGVPSELLRRRPDIRQAEADAHAATARVGVAVADLYPKFTLTGSAGAQASSLGALSDPASRFWSIAQSVTAPLFASGRLRSAVEQQKALRDQAVIRYQQKVLAALQEVEDALIASAKEEERRKALVEAVTASRKAAELAVSLYSAGQVDFLGVLDAQRSLYTSEDALVQSNRTVSTNLVALYKALGGGWKAEALP